MICFAVYCLNTPTFIISALRYNNTLLRAITWLIPILLLFIIMHRKVFDENMHTSFTSYHSIMKIVFKNQNICTYIVCENVLDLMKNVKYFYK